MSNTTSKNNKSSSKNQNLNIFSQVNIGGLSLHSKIALDKFTFDNNISLVALQETKLNENQIDSIDKFVNLESFFVPKFEHTYGVGLLISELLLPQHISELDQQDCDIIWCLININNSSVLVASAYTPPNNATKLMKLLNNINQAQAYAVRYKIKSILVFGDFNGRNLMWGDTKNNKHGHKLLEFVDKSNFMLCTPADKTFISPNNGGSVIDLLLGLGPITNTISNNWTDRSTDLFTGAPIRGHFPVLYSLGACPILTESKQYDDFHSTDWSLWKEALDSNLSNLRWSTDTEDNLSILDYLVNGFNQAIQSANENIPKKIVTMHSKPFWCDSLTICKKELEELNIAVRRRCTPLNNKLHREKKEEFKSLLISEKNEWIRQKLTDINISDSKLFWKRYKFLFHDQQSNFIGNLSKNGILYSSSSDKEKVLYNEFFSGEHLKGHNFDEEFANKVMNSYHSIQKADMLYQSSLINNVKDTLADGFQFNTIHDLSDLNNDSLSDEITMFELEGVIKERKTEGKSTDSYDVNPVMLKHLSPTAKYILLTIFNLSLETGHWCWNKQNVCFIKKTGKPNYLDPGSYRPISLSSNIGKILEKVLELRLRVYCKNHKILDTPQEGFCPNRSTTRYLFKLLANLGEAKKKKLISMVLLIDFQKAFDSVWIPGLIVKLYHYGIRGKILQLLNSFLSNRLVQLKVNGKTGEFYRLTSLVGLPQGSILSPLLFIIYISEMLQGSHNVFHDIPYTCPSTSKAYKYADDGTVSVIGKDIQACLATLQAICDKLYHWCRKWRLLINCDQNKTEVLIINGSNEETPRTLPPVKIGDVALQYVEKSRVLGVTIDKELSFSHHAKDMLKRCWYQWYKITKGTSRQSGLNTSSLTLMFKTLVLTKLMYAAPAWLDKQLMLFKNLWSRVLLKIVGAQYHTERSITEALLNLPPLEVHLEVISVKFLLKCLYSDDEMIAILLTINDNPSHPLFIKSQQLKKYILWKENGCSVKKRCSTHGIDLINFLEHDTCYYTKEDMELYLNTIWWKKVSHIHPHLDTSSWIRSNSKLIFSRSSVREVNSLHAEFIHGHSLSFQNFSKAVGQSLSDLCKFCNTAQEDSTAHQLFECPSFDCTHRDSLLQLLDNNIVDFQWTLAVSNMNKDCSQIMHTFVKLVNLINEESRKINCNINKNNS